MSERAAPQHCPYCAEEDLVPQESEADPDVGYAWACLSCARVFRVKFVGLRTATVAGMDPSTERTDDNG